MKRSFWIWLAVLVIGELATAVPTYHLVDISDDGDFICQMFPIDDYSCCRGIFYPDPNGKTVCDHGEIVSAKTGALIDVLQPYDGRVIGINGTEILINEVEYVFGPPIQSKKNRPKGLREMIKMLLDNEFTAPILREVLSSQLDNVRGHQKPGAQKPQEQQQQQQPQAQPAQQQQQQQQQQQPQRQPQKFERLGPTTSAKKIIANKDPAMAKRDSELPQPVASVPTYWPTEQAPQAAQQKPQTHSIVQTPPPLLNYNYVQAQPIGPNFYQPPGSRQVQPVVYYPPQLPPQQEQPQSLLTRMKSLFPPGTNFAQVSGGVSEVQKTMLVLSPLMRRRPGLYSSSKGPAPSNRFDPIWSQAASRHTPQFGMTIIG